jgi:type IV pilus assembly protein PilW
MKMTCKPTRQRGVTLIELMVTIAITLFLVAAAAYVYLNTRETQRAIERSSSNDETGEFALQLIGREIMKAGFYPATVTRISATEIRPKLTSFPPVRLAQNAATTTDWTPPTTTPAGVYLSGLFGCDSAKFLPVTGACDTPVSGAADSIVINYFTSDNMGSAQVGDSFDCAGNSVNNDSSNTNRLNTTNTLAPPLQPLLVSNRFGLNATKTEIDKQVVNTLSLACNGNGANPKTNTYQPLVAGIEDLQFTYGVFASTADTTRLTPDNFYTASYVTNNLGSVTVDTGTGPILLPPWSRVVAVRVCIMTKSMGASPRIGDASGSARTYVDCNGVTVTPTDANLRKRFVQIFAVRNRLNQVF